jgi:hypothetical protein
MKTFLLFAFRLLLCVLTGVIVSCFAVAQEGYRVPGPDDKAAFDRYVAEGRDSPFGLDYVFVLERPFRDPELARFYGEEIGVRWVNFTRVAWGAIERKPPVNGQHRYDWSALDEGVRQWQRRGVHILMTVFPMANWGTAHASVDEPLYMPKWWVKNTVYLPTPEHMPDYRAFITALVQRYAGDGTHDMPGLRFPILHYQVHNECFNEVFWAGTVEEYGLLLKETALAARKANPKVKIVLAGVGLREVPGFYDDKPDPRSQTWIDQNVAKVPPRMLKFCQRAFEWSKKSLTFGDYYDILDARWSNYGIVNFWRRQLQEAGYPNKEIWSAELNSAFLAGEDLMLPNSVIHAWPLPSRNAEYRRILHRPGDKQYPVISNWYRGLQAATDVKVALVGLHAGTKMLMMDWAVDQQSPLAVDGLAYQGLWSSTTRKGWPAAYTYGLLIQKLDGYQSIRRLPMPENIFVYECTVRDGRKVLVAFCDDHIGQNHDEPMAEMDATIPLPTGPVRLTHIITDIGVTTPKAEMPESIGGNLKLRLTEYPVFLEPGRKP